MSYKMKRGQNIIEETGSCKENRQKLHMSRTTCIENPTFLCTTQTKRQSNGHTKF